ncbi:hypothetical protein ABIA33_003574 [Streptacidiphilus sp. MAP12-16]
MVRQLEEATITTTTVVITTITVEVGLPLARWELDSVAASPDRT